MVESEGRRRCNTWSGLRRTLLNIFWSVWRHRSSKLSISGEQKPTQVLRRRNPRFSGRNCTDVDRSQVCGLLNQLTDRRRDPSRSLQPRTCYIISVIPGTEQCRCFMLVQLYLWHKPILNLKMLEKAATGLYPSNAMQSVPWQCRC